jgi:hypothetical protein
MNKQQFTGAISPYTRVLIAIGEFQLVFKKFNLAALLFFALKPCFSQMHISTSMRSDYDWDANKKQWVWASDNENEKTFFEINPAFTLMKHTTPKITSTYIITSSKEDKDNQFWECKVTSDVGNKYTLYIDLKNNMVKFVGQDKDSSYFLVKHNIRKVWYDNKEESTAASYTKGWTSANEKQFMESCVGEAKKNVTEARAKAYCSCAMLKAKQVYPAYTDLGNLTEAEKNVIAAACNK